MAQEIELSISETNKLRAQLGLPLIPDPDGIGSSQKAEDYSFSNDSANLLRKSLGLRPKESPDNDMLEKKEKSRKQVNDKKSLKEEKLFYKDIESTESWLENIGKKRQVERTEIKTSQPEKLEQKAEDDKPEFTLAHANMILELGDGDILTLEDGSVVDEVEEDILVNENIKKLAKEKKDNLERKKMGQLEYGLRERFHEEDNQQNPEFKLPLVEGKIAMSGVFREGKAASGSGLNDDWDPKVGNSEELYDDDLEILNIRDQNQRDRRKRPAVMKKLKKVKKPAKKRRRDDVLVEVSEPMFTAALDVEEDNDDELELVLATSRKNKQKQRKMLTAEEIANEIKLHLRADAVAEIGEGFVYDDTKEFLDSLMQKKEEVTEDTKQQRRDEEIDNLGSNKDLERPGESISNDSKKEESKEKSEEKLEADGESETKGNSEEPEELSDPANVDSTVPKFNTLLDTLRYLRQNNPTEENKSDRTNRQAQREAELARIKISIEERIVREELLKDHSYIGAPNEEKEQIVDRVLNDRLVAKGVIPEMARGKYSRYTAQKDPLSSYNPQVKLRYSDSSGQQLDTKQAWKELLHKYHGLEPKHKKQKSKPQKTNEKVIG